jgi:perosamine synthetase
MNKPETQNIPLATPTFDKEMEAAALNALRNQHFVLGEDVYKFEEEFAKYVGSKYAVSTSSGTNALQFSMLALGISTADQVITSPFSFIATANAIVHAGATPIFADIEPETFNIDPEKIKPKITKHTKALVPVHLYGYPCNMQKIMEIAEKHKLLVVEDTCQAHGAEYHGQKAGAIGDVGCFSFYPSKNLTVCGDGGMIVTNDKETAETAAKLRDCGRKTKYEHDAIGYTSRLNTVNAAIGRVQLRKLDEWNKKRNQNAALYDKLLSDIDELALPPKGTSQIKPVYHLYVIKTKAQGKLREWLQKNGIQCGIHYPLPIPLQPIYKELFKFKGGEYPISERVSKECLSLPMSPHLTEDNIWYISEKIHEFYETP